MCEAIEAADQIILGPGSLFTSVLAACVVPDIAAALNKRTGGRVYVCNLHPEVPETAGYRPSDHVRALAEHGITVDTVLCDARWWPDADVATVMPGPPDVRLVLCDLTTDPDAGHDADLLAAALRTVL